MLTLCPSTCISLCVRGVPNMICRGSFMTPSGRFRGRRRDGSSRRAIQNSSDDCPPGMASARSFASGSRAADTTRTCGSNGRYARSSIFSTPTRFAEGLWTPPPSGCGPVHATGQAWTEFSWKWTRSRTEQHTAGQDRPWHTLVLPLGNLGTVPMFFTCMGGDARGGGNVVSSADARRNSPHGVNSPPRVTPPVTHKSPSRLTIFSRAATGAGSKWVPTEEWTLAKPSNTDTPLRYGRSD